MVKFLFGKSKAMTELQKTIEKIAVSELPIFIEGETGTGKTLLAREIHKNSQESNGLFVYLDCATISPSLMESELFGHEKGAFTGATHRKSGLFELACGGTVFLDEIENLDLPIQAKLLRVLEEKKFRRVGGTEEMEVYFRLISASNFCIEKKIKERAFRQDLYYRLRGIKLYLPPLRERKQDILELANYFLNFYNKKTQSTKKLSQAVKSYLITYSWAGNVRELKYAIEEAAVKANGDEIHLDSFSLDLLQEFVVFESKENQLSLIELEKKYISMILKSVAFNKTHAAKIMGIGVNTLYRKIDKYGITVEERK